jgi:hypothetical protein
MTSRDVRRRELGLIASYLRELRQQTRAAATGVVREVSVKPHHHHHTRRGRRVSPPTSR